MTEEELPTTWTRVLLEDVADVGARTDLPDLDQEDEVSFVPMAAVAEESGVIELETRSYGSVAKGYTRFREGDVLFAKITPCMENGKIAVARNLSDGIGFGTTELVVIRPKTDINPDYLRLFLVQRRFRQTAERHMTGAVGQRRVPTPYLRAAELPLAPANEQRRIVERIDELFSQIEAGEAALARAKRLLARYRQAVLKAAVSGELTRDWRERHQAEIEPATHLLSRILQARREAWEKAELEKLEAKGKPPKDEPWKKKYKEPEPPDTTDLPELPEGWVWASIGQLFRVSVGATPDRANPRYWNGDIPWISSGEVRFSTIYSSRETISEAGLQNSSTHLLDVGTVLLAMIGEGKTRGQAALLGIRACANQNACAIHVSRTPISPAFVYFYLMSQYDENRRISSGGNQPALNSRRVMEMNMALPPFEEMVEITDRVADHISVLDHLDGEIVDSERRAAALRQAILTAAFTGKLVPQDPADEPAASLLDRIRAEQPAIQATKPRRGRPPSGISARGAVAGDLPLFSGHAAAGGDRS